ncbi:MAG: hypothetical protein IKP22_06430 [Clostridia bacterium]|nr:hypothetical protein [Clostridia bacterium]
MYSDESKRDLIRKMEEVERQNRDRMVSGIGNLIGVMVALTIILLLSALLFSLVKWLRQDMRSVFSVLIDSFR